MKKLILVIAMGLVALPTLARESDVIYRGSAKPTKTLSFTVSAPNECIYVGVASTLGQPNQVTLQLGNGKPRSGPIANAPVSLKAEGQGRYTIRVTATQSSPLLVKARATKKSPVTVDHRGVRRGGTC